MSVCIIVVCPPGKTPERRTLLDCMKDNRDGSGYAIRTPHGIRTGRSARDAERMLGDFELLRAEYPQSWAIWHSRIATHGTLTDDNTHPFRIPGRPWVLAHNGVMDLHDGPFDRRQRSDTRIMVEDIFSAVTWADLLECKDSVETWLGSDKVVIMSERKERGGPVVIYNEDRGTWAEDDGCWYSRWMWRPSKHYASSYWADKDRQAAATSTPAKVPATVSTDPAAGSIPVSAEAAKVAALFDGVDDDDETIRSEILEEAEATGWDGWTYSDCRYWCSGFEGGCAGSCPFADATESDLDRALAEARAAEDDDLVSPLIDEALSVGDALDGEPLDEEEKEGLLQRSRRAVIGYLAS